MTRFLAQIGCGHWGRNLARNFNNLGALAAICDDDDQTASAQSELLGVPRRPMDDLLKDPSVTAFALASPAATHASLAQKALNAGKHVFIEKPLALTMKDGKAVAELAQKKGRVLMVGHLLRYHPVFLALEKLVHDGSLGKLRHIHSTRKSTGKIRSEEDVFLSFAPHDISMILALANEEFSQFSCSSSAHLQDGIADIADCDLIFPSGLHAHIATSWIHPFKEQKLIVIGDKAMAVFDDQKPWTEKLQIFRHKIGSKEERFAIQKDPGSFMDVQQDEPLKCECQHFLDAIKNSTAPRTDAKEALAVLSVLETFAQKKHHLTSSSTQQLSSIMG